MMEVRVRLIQEFAQVSVNQSRHQSVQLNVCIHHVVMEFNNLQIMIEWQSNVMMEMQYLEMDVMKFVWQSSAEMDWQIIIDPIIHGLQRMMKNVTGTILQFDHDVSLRVSERNDML